MGLGDHLEFGLLAEAGAHHIAQMADPIDEPQSESLAAGPKGAGEKLRFLGAEFTAAARTNQRLEVFMDVELQFLQAFDVFALFGLERIEHRLAFAGGMYAPLDAEFPDRLDKTETRRNDANRADDGA